VVLCVDEKTSVQAVDRTQPVLPLRPGLPERRTHEYLRHGTTSLFAALDAATGQVVHQTTAVTGRLSSASSWPRSTARCPPNWTCT
jgi:hypothetical protein